MKRKLTTSEVSPSDLEDDLYVPRPAKRLTMCYNTPKQARDDKKKLLRTSRKKLKQLTQPEANLHRSLLVNNVYRQLQAELKQDKPAKSYGYAFNPKCPFGYGAGQKEVANRKKLAKLQEVLDKKAENTFGGAGKQRLGGSEAGHVTWLRNPAARKCLKERSSLTCEEFLAQMDSSAVTVAMDCGQGVVGDSATSLQQRDTTCHVTEETSDTEEIDVCTVEDEISAPVSYVHTVNQDCTGPASHLHTVNQDIGNFQESSMDTTYFSSQSNPCERVLMSESAAVGEVPWISSVPSDSRQPCDDNTMRRDPCGRSGSSYKASPYPEPYLPTHPDSIYRQSFHPYCFSSNPFYPSITPPGYLSPALCSSLSALYPHMASGLYSSQVAAIPGPSDLAQHPAASMVTCT